MKNKSVLFLNIVLIVSVLALGYFVFEKSNLKLPKVLSDQSQVDATSNTETIPSESSENNVLIFPADDATQELRDKHFSLVLEQAKDTDSVTIKDCKPEPLVARVKDKSKLTIRNESSKDHNLVVVVKSDGPYQLKAQESLEISVDFGKGPGVYRYTCDSEFETAGVFFVVN